MPQPYFVSGRTAATAATAGHAAAQLWNPHATVRVTVWEIWIGANAAPAASCAVHVRRSTTRGTGASTVTPAIQNDGARGGAPPSGFVVDLAAFSVQPTLEAIALAGWTLGAVAGSGIIMPFPRGIEVPPGAGLVLVCGNAVAIPASDITFVASS